MSRPILTEALLANHLKHPDKAGELHARLMTRAGEIATENRVKIGRVLGAALVVISTLPKSVRYQAETLFINIEPEMRKVRGKGTTKKAAEEHTGNRFPTHSVFHHTTGGGKHRKKKGTGG